MHYVIQEHHYHVYEIWLYVGITTAHVDAYP